MPLDTFVRDGSTSRNFQKRAIYAKRSVAQCRVELGLRGAGVLGLGAGGRGSLLIRKGTQ